MPSPIGPVSPSFVCRVHIPPGLRLPHADGGSIEFLEPSDDWTIQLEVIFRAPDGERNDVLAMRHRIADDQGRVHEVITRLSVYEIWEIMCQGVCESPAAFAAGWRRPKGEPTTLLSGLKFWSDGRDDRYVAVQEEAGKHPQVFRVREKYLSGELSLHIDAESEDEDFAKPSTRVIVEWKSFVGMQSVCDPPRDAPSTWMTSLYWPQLLWLNHQVEEEEEGYKYWARSSMPLPLVFSLTGDTSEPNEDVVWRR